MFVCVCLFFFRQGKACVPLVRAVDLILTRAVCCVLAKAECLAIAKGEHLIGWLASVICPYTMCDAYKRSMYGFNGHLISDSYKNRLHYSYRIRVVGSYN